MKVVREGCRTNVFSSIGRAGRLMAEAFAYMPRVFLNSDARRSMLFQLYSTGIRTLPVITVVGLFTGMILGLQVGLALRKFNQEMFLGATVMITLVREMGPFVTGICLSACVGSAMAAELGTMKVNDEIAALEADGYKKTAWGSAIVDNEKEYGDYLFYKYDYNKAPIYLFPFSPNVMSTGGFTNGYGFANNE